MNLLNYTYELVKNYGGAIPLNTLTEIILSSKEIAIEDRKKFNSDRLAEIILKNGTNIWLDEDLVKIKKKSTTNISSLFVELSDMFRLENSRFPEQLALGLIFYKRLADSQSNYLTLKEFDLLEIDKISKTKDPKQKLISEFNKINTSILFDHSADQLISDLEIISTNTLKFSILKLTEFDLSSITIPNKQFANQFEKLTVIIKKLKKIEHEIPLFIREIISSLSSFAPFKSVYDPYFSTPLLFENIVSNCKDSSIEFIGEGASFASLLLQRMSSCLYEFKQINISKNNPIYHSKTRPNSFELIVSHPPFSSINFSGASDPSSAIISFILSRLTEKGRAIIAVNNSILSSLNNEHYSVKKRLIENDLLEFVIYVPSGVYQSTPISSSIFVINKNKGQGAKNKIAFVDSTSIYASIIDTSQIHEITNNFISDISNFDLIDQVKYTVDNEFVKQNNYQLQVPLYVNSYLKKLELLKQKGAVLKHIKNTLLDIYFEPNTNNQNFKIVTSIFLAKNKHNKYLKIQDLPIAKPDDAGKIVTQDAVIIGKIEGELSVSIFKYSSEPIIVSQNLIVLIPDEKKIEIEYLEQILNNEIVKEQLYSKTKDTASQYYTIDDIKNLVIPLPSLKEQSARVLLNDSSELSKLQNEKEAITKEKIQAEYAILSSLKHSFGQKPFNNYLKNIETYINESINLKKIPNWEDKLSKHHSSLTLKQTIDSLFGLVSDTNDLFSGMQDLFSIDNSTLKLEKIKVHNFLNETLNEISGIEGFDFRYAGKNIEVSIDKTLFKQLISNLVTNSIKHGYNNKGNGLKEIVFETEYYENEMKWTLDFYNNGESFPEDFTFEDFISFGRKSNKSGGSGIGGYLIKKIVDKHNGSFTIENMNNKPYFLPPVLVQETDERGDSLFVNHLILGGVKFSFIFNTQNYA